MSAFIYYKLNNKTQEYLCGPLVTIGRSRTNNIVFPDPKVSRNHLLLRCLGEDKYYLIDMGSANGTYLNGKRVIVPTLLKNGDVINVGSRSNVLTFRLNAGRKEQKEAEDLEDLATTFALEAPAIREVTVLVADIRDYTSMSEQLPIDLLAKLLGEWFRSVNDIIEKNGGGVDKFIGDAVMACWLMSKENPEEDIKKTLKAAYEIHIMTEGLNRTHPQLPKPIRIGVGINTGEAIVGDLGSGRLQDYTVLGDSVNVAFRLEKASKELNVDLVISHNSFKYLPKPSWEKRQRFIKVKGKDEPVKVYPLKFHELIEV